MTPTIDEFRKQAEHLYVDIVLLPKDAAIRHLVGVIRAAHQRGWNDKQEQLANTAYPR